MVKIIADSTCDLSPDIIASLNITLTPLFVMVDGQSYKDGVDIKPTDVFHFMENEKKTCRTTAVNQYDYMQVFKEFSPQYESVVQLCIGSEFSACYQNAVLAAQEFDNVHVINTQNLSTGSGYLVYEAALMAQDGASADAIIKMCEETAPKIDCSFVIDRMDYLHKGGRCSGLESIGARILSIKPCIEVADGKMRVGKKYRGALKICLEKYVLDRLAEKTNIDYKRIFITYSSCSQDILEMVKDLIQKNADFCEIIETHAGCTVCNHCGPNTLGVIYKHI